MDIKMITKTRFKSPRRRLTRQRSGFKVSGEKKGSTSKIKKTKILNVKGNNFKLDFIRKKLKPIPLFLKNKGLLGFGGYINTNIDLTAILEISANVNGASYSNSRESNIKKENWNKLGVLLELEIDERYEISNLKARLKLKSREKNIGEVSFFGFNLDVIDFPYFKENDVEDIFYEKLPIYLPDIFYLQFDEPFIIKPNIDMSMFKEGKIIVLKSCNRCSRYLPIDFENERNTLSFSNHCFKQAPCTHKSFSNYSITDSDYSNLPDVIKSKLDDDRLMMYYGFQLECKSCKKFFVNAPLNPLRNSRLCVTLNP